MQDQTSRPPLRTIRPFPRRISVFDGQDLKKALLSGAAWLEEHREQINALNVFPVPDGDTGSNMSKTMQAAVRGIEDSADTSAGVISAKLAHGALLGARGNSGVILSQILRGLALGLDKKTTFTAQDLANAMQEAQRLLIAYAPYKFHVHRIWTDMAQPWVKGYSRNLFVRDFGKYVDIDADAQAQAQ